MCTKCVEYGIIISVIPKSEDEKIVLWRLYEGIVVRRA